LPEWEEDDRLDGQELPDGLEGWEELAGGVVEQEQGVQGQGHGHVVDDRDVQVPTVRTGGAEMVAG